MLGKIFFKYVVSLISPAQAERGSETLPLVEWRVGFLREGGGGWQRRSHQDHVPLQSAALLPRQPSRYISVLCILVCRKDECAKEYRITDTLGKCV